MSILIKNESINYAAYSFEIINDNKIEDSFAKEFDNKFLEGQISAILNFYEREGKNFKLSEFVDKHLSAFKDNKNGIVCVRDIIML